jgi:hypothetical protein
MMFASAVRSPVPVTVTRREPEPLSVPAMTFALSTFGTGPDSPVISVPVEPASHQSPRKHTTSPYRATRE